MNTILRISLKLAVLVVVGALGLIACGEPDPIAVYVTPTPIPLDTETPTPLATVPDTTLVSAQSPLSQGTVEPTPQTLPGVTFGPITGPDYTPEPLFTALPPVVHEQPCRAIIAVPELAVYGSPDKTAQVVGAAAERQKLEVSELHTDGSGNRWARTPAGWITLTDSGTEPAQLDSIRACEILQGNTPVTTLLGLHVINETKSGDVIEFVRRMATAGLPVGTVKGLNGAEAMLNEIELISPQTVTVYRSLLTPNGLEDCPNTSGDTLPDPAVAAREWIDGLRPLWDVVNADYYELLNECSVPIDWLSAFSVEAMKIANAEERCLLIFSLPGGTPDMAVFNDLLPAYQYAAENPCQPGRTHAVALHAYSMEDDRLVSESDVWIAFRHRIFYERLLMQLPQAAELPVYVTELGIGGGQTMPSCETVTRDVLQYTYQLEEDPYVKGFHLWSVGTGAVWYDVSPCLPQIADALLAYYGE